MIRFQQKIRSLSERHQVIHLSLFVFLPIRPNFVDKRPIYWRFQAEVQIHDALRSSLECKTQRRLREREAYLLSVRDRRRNQPQSRHEWMTSLQRQHGSRVNGARRPPNRGGIVRLSAATLIADWQCSHVNQLHLRAHYRPNRQQWHGRNDRLGLSRRGAYI